MEGTIMNHYSLHYYSTASSICVGEDDPTEDKGTTFSAQNIIAFSGPKPEEQK
jgi:hypothetical protein